MLDGSDPFVRFRNVQKSYDGETLVVKNLNLDIEAGEFVTMLGPSGSGKTTCLMMLAGFETATHGEIELGGRPINNIPPHKRGIGMVFQNYALFPHMTVAENLSFPLKVRKMSAGETGDKVRRALDMVQMRDFADRKPAQLSGGQQQRAAIARALAMRPKALLFDEPTSALDPELELEVVKVIRELAAEGRTMILVTHDMRLARDVSTHVMFLNQGVVEEQGTPEDVFGKPKTERLRQFLHATSPAA